MLFNIDSHTEAVELQKTTVLFNYLFENSAPWWTQWLEDSGGAEGYYSLYPIVNESSYKTKFGRSLTTLSGQSTHKHKRNCIIICFSIHTLWHHLLLYYNLFLSIFPLLSFFFFLIQFRNPNGGIKALASLYKYRKTNSFTKHNLQK